MDPIACRHEVEFASRYLPPLISHTELGDNNEKFPVANIYSKRAGLLIALTKPSPMDHHHGVFHKTTVKSTISQGTTFHTTTIAGVKRSHPETLEGPKRQTPFRNASSIGRELPRLIASVINPVGLADTPHVSEYSQRKAISATPTSRVDRALSLSHPRYDLPSCLVNNMRALGINEIYLWQKQCLMGPGLLTGKKNLVYTAPTGGGKSLVADILMLKRVLEDRNAKALLVLPYVALVQEKVRWLRRVVENIKRQPAEDAPERQRLWQKRPDEDNIRVVGFFGGGKIRATWSDFEIGVCTFEKVRYSKFQYDLF